VTKKEGTVFTRKPVLILLLLAGLALILVACGGEPTPTPTAVSVPAPAQTEPTPTPTPESAPPAQADAPTDTPAPAAPVAPAPSGDWDPASITTPTDLSSYRSFMSILVTQIVGGQETTENVDFDVEFTSEPLAQHVSVSGSGFDETSGMDSMEWYLIEDMLYMSLGPDQWLSMPASEGEDLTAGLVEPDALLDDTCGWQSQGTTTLDGIQVERWTTNQAQIEACTPPEELTGLGDLTDAGGEMFVAVDGGYVTQLDLFYAGTNLDLGIVATDEPVGEGRLDFSYQLTDVNEPFTIDLPPGAAAAASGPEDIPIPDNAQGVTNMGSLITFTSPDSPAQVSEYYQEQMPGFGWSEVSVQDLGGPLMLEFSKEGKTASIMLQPGDAGGTSALITIE
jgi:hypothetical protein